MKPAAAEASAHQPAMDRTSQMPKQRRSDKPLDLPHTAAAATSSSRSAAWKMAGKWCGVEIMHATIIAAGKRKLKQHV